jgi:hypothetical protein
MQANTVTHFWLWRDGGKLRDSWWVFLINEKKKLDGAIVIGVVYDAEHVESLNNRISIEEARRMHKDLRNKGYTQVDPIKFRPAGLQMDVDEILRQYKIIDNAK